MPGRPCRRYTEARATYGYTRAGATHRNHTGNGNGKSLERAGSVTGEVVLRSGLVDNGGCSQDYCRRCMEPRCIIVSQYPISWAYSCSIYHNHTTNTTDTTDTAESVRSTKEPIRRIPNTSPKSKLPNLHRMLLFGE